MEQDHYDYIIVGSGLAGVTLAMHLHEVGKKLIIFEGTQPNNSSYVAAGLFNPITGRKMVKTWKADGLFPYLKSYYRNIESSTGGNFLHEMPIYRPFLEAEEQNEWMGKSSDENFEPYISQVFTQSISAKTKDPFGGIKLNHCGYLDIPLYLKHALSVLSAMQHVVRKDFDHEKLEVGSDKLTYEGLTAKKIIFCEGVGLQNNKFFNWLPLSPAKGEILFIKLLFEADYILNRGIFVIPTGDGICKVGSTYDHQDLSLEPTLKAREQILRKLRELLAVDFEVVGQIAGLRPATKDRRPFIGMHPKFETIGVFNGLGTKGVSLAPYWSGHFAGYLEQGKKLHDDVNISRYFSLYSGLRESDE